MFEAMSARVEETGADQVVLLVEDVAAMRLYLRYALEGQGVQVIEAGDLDSARLMLRGTPRPTSVLLDLELPDGHGLDLLADVPAGVPVAALTGDDSSETARRCRERGCTLVLSKNSRLGDIGKLLLNLERDRSMRPLPRWHGSELAERYARYLADTLQQLQRAARDQDLGAARIVSHRLRGTAVHFGYGSIGACAGELGKAIASGDTKVIAVALETLLERLGDVVGVPDGEVTRAAVAGD
jgi:CheY-like chemotaxis protein